MKLYNINLQLFGTNVTTDAGMSAEMKTFYDMALIDSAAPELVHDQFAQKRDIPANGGKKIEFRKFAPLNKAVTPITEGTTPAGSSLAVTAIEATVLQYGDFIEQSDVLELTAIDNTIAEALKILGRQAGATLDTVTREAMHAGTNVSFASKWAGGTETEVTKRGDLDESAVLKVDTVNQVVAKLRAANAPTINGYYAAIIHPYVAYDLMKDPDWKAPHRYADTENLYKGEIGEVGGVRFVQSTEAKIYGPETGLLVNKSGGYTGAITSVAFDGKLEGKDVEASDLVGKYISINGITAKITANTITMITCNSTDFGTVADNASIEIVPCAAGAVFGTIFVGDGAYGTTSVDGGGLETFVKQLGSAGTADPLNQRSTIGWKAQKTATILIPDYLVRVESCSSRYSKTAAAN